MANRLCGMFRTLLLAFVSLAILACSPISAPLSSTPTADPDIYNQVPSTTVFDPGQCAVVLTAPAPAYSSDTLGGQPSGEIAAGTYEVGVAAVYSSSTWYMLNVEGEANFVNSSSVTSMEGDCSTGSN